MWCGKQIGKLAVEQKENKWENCEQNNNKEVRREIMGPPKMRFLDTKYYQRRREKKFSADLK